MPTDVHGITHAGAIGLYDDDEENAASLARAERCEVKDLEKVIRRADRRSKRQERKDDKVAQRDTNNKAKLSQPASWFGHLLSGGKDPSPKRTGAKPVHDKEGGSKTKIPITSREEWMVVRRPEEPDAVYTVQDVDSVDSPFLRECGMVRVVSDDAVGCHIVAKSRIEKNG